MTLEEKQRENIAEVMAEAERLAADGYAVLKSMSKAELKDARRRMRLRFGADVPDVRKDPRCLADVAITRELSERGARSRTREIASSSALQKLNMLQGRLSAICNDIETIEANVSLMAAPAPLRVDVSGMDDGELSAVRSKITSLIAQAPSGFGDTAALLEIIKAPAAKSLASRIVEYDESVRAYRESLEDARSQVAGEISRRAEERAAHEARKRAEVDNLPDTVEQLKERIASLEEQLKGRG